MNLETEANMRRVPARTRMTQFPTLKMKPACSKPLPFCLPAGRLVTRGHSRVFPGEREASGEQDAVHVEVLNSPVITSAGNCLDNWMIWGFSSYQFEFKVIPPFVLRY